MLTQTSNKEKTANKEAQVHHCWKPITTGFNRSNQMFTQTSNKEKKKQRSKLSSPRIENPSSRVDTVKLDAKTQTSNKEKKGKKKKNREANFSSPILDSM